MNRRTALALLVGIGALSQVLILAQQLATDPLALVPGAAVFAVGAELLHVFTVVWIPHSLDSKSEIYGAIGIALVLLFWAYLLGRLMTLAASLNVALWRRRTEHPLTRPAFIVKVPLVGGLLGRVWERLIGRPG